MCLNLLEPKISFNEFAFLTEGSIFFKSFTYFTNPHLPLTLLDLNSSIKEMIPPANTFGQAVDSHSLFMCQDKNEDENQCFCLFLEVMRDKRTNPLMYHSTEAWFVRHRLYPEQTKTFVFGFVSVFVLAHEQHINAL